jgi:hypothetical protein
LPPFASRNITPAAAARTRKPLIMMLFTNVSVAPRHGNLYSRRQAGPSLNFRQIVLPKDSGLRHAPIRDREHSSLQRLQASCKFFVKDRS